MTRFTPLFLLLACDAPSPLGGQEGEPLAPEAPPPPADFDDVDAEPGAPCEPVASCTGDGWCAQYSADTTPDLEASCEGHWAAAPCPTEGVTGACVVDDADACTVVVVYAPGDAESMCPLVGMSPAR